MNKNKLLLTSTAALMALSISCGSTKPIKPIEFQKPKTEQVSEEKNIIETPRYRSFNNKKVVTLGEVNKETKEEKETDTYNKTLKEFNKQVALLNLKISNNEEIKLEEICNLRKLYTELTYLANSVLENTFTNADSLGQIIVKKGSKDLEEKLISVHEIESYFYGVSKEYDLEREASCFVGGKVIPTMVRLKHYSESVNKEYLNEESVCKINDYILKLTELLDNSTSLEQREYLFETILTLRKLLPSDVKNVDSLDFKDDCDILFPIRE